MIRGEETAKQAAISLILYFVTLLVHVYMMGIQQYENTAPVPQYRFDGLRALLAEDIFRCKNAGMDAHISKPIDLDRLYETIRHFWKKENGGQDE